jgi:hypothetical protein
MGTLTNLERRLLVLDTARFLSFADRYARADLVGRVPSPL